MVAGSVGLCSVVGRSIDCWWIGGRLSKVSGLMEDLLVGYLSFVSGRWPSVVSGFVMRLFSH